MHAPKFILKHKRFRRTQLRQVFTQISVDCRCGMLLRCAGVQMQVKGGRTGLPGFWLPLN